MDVAIYSLATLHHDRWVCESITTFACPSNVSRAASADQAANLIVEVLETTDHRRCRRCHRCLRRHNIHSRVRARRCRRCTRRHRLHYRHRGRLVWKWWWRGRGSWGILGWRKGRREGAGIAWSCRRGGGGGEDDGGKGNDGHSHRIHSHFCQEFSFCLRGQQ